MIDFQDKELCRYVYELLIKIQDLYCSDDVPRFHTKQIENGGWECSLQILGVKENVIAYGKTEVESVNNCAYKMKNILERDHPDDDFDPDVENSIFRGNIEQFFDEINYDPHYKYHLYETDVLLDTDDYVAVTLRRMIEDGFKECDGEIDKMSDIATLRFLVKKKKDNYC